MAHVDIEVKPLRIKAIKVGKPKPKPKPKEDKDAKSTK